jgi:hypothetical protein
MEICKDKQGMLFFSRHSTKGGMRMNKINHHVTVQTMLVILPGSTC